MRLQGVMHVEALVRCIGISHLLQPPLTLLLARQLGLRHAFAALPPLPSRIAENMALAAVALPTSFGLVLAAYPEDALCGGPTRAVGFVLAAFWSARLVRQVRDIGPLLPSGGGIWHPLLTLVFTAQGPVLGALLLWSWAR